MLSKRAPNALAQDSQAIGRNAGLSTACKAVLERELPCMRVTPGHECSFGQWAEPQTTYGDFWYPFSAPTCHVLGCIRRYTAACCTGSLLICSAGTVLLQGWLSWEHYRCNTDCTKDPENCISEHLIRYRPVKGLRQQACKGILTLQ